MRTYILYTLSTEWCTLLSKMLSTLITWIPIQVLGILLLLLFLNYLTGKVNTFSLIVILVLEIFQWEKNSHFSQCSKTGTTKAVVCAIPSVEWSIQIIYIFTETYIKDPLLHIAKSSLCSGGRRFPLSLSLWFFTVCPIHITINKCERENLLPPHWLLFLINSKGSFICTTS